jgi:DNA polymerase III subunit gamma/tau
MATLYNKHRPQTFEEVVGQNHIKATLEQEIIRGRLAHAYLFCGPRGIGKTTLARVLARAANCLERKEKSAEPCNKCVNCLMIAGGQSLDVVEIDAASHTGVDNVRENIIAGARLAPGKARFKFFIIDEVHMLSTSAFNALLKILEEPPESAVFVLCTTEVHKIPATIISRCQRFDFKKISVAEIAKKLERIAVFEGIKAGQDVLEEIARHSEGHMRDAESMLGQIAAIAGAEITADDASLVIPKSDLKEAAALIGYLARKDAPGAIGLVNSLFEEGYDLKTYLNNTVEMARKLMLGKISPALEARFAREWGEAVDSEARKAGEGLKAEDLAQIMEELMQARHGLKDAWILQLPIELAIVRLAGRQAQSKTPSASPASKALPGGASAASDSIFSAPKNPDDVPAVDLDHIHSKWSEVLARVLKHNHSLSLILRVCQPRNVQGNRLCLAFKYKFHKERVENPQIKKLVEDTLREVFMSNLEVVAEIDETLEINDSGQDVLAENQAEPEAASGESSEVINNLLRTFGGKVVE